MRSGYSMRSTSACRFLILVDTIEDDNVTYFQVIPHNANMASEQLQNYIVLVTSEGLLATSYEDFLSFGMPDVSLLTLWSQGYKFNYAFFIILVQKRNETFNRPIEVQQ